MSMDLTLALPRSPCYSALSSTSTTGSLQIIAQYPPGIPVLMSGMACGPLGMVFVRVRTIAVLVRDGLIRSTDPAVRVRDAAIRVRDVFVLVRDPLILSEDRPIPVSPKTIPAFPGLGETEIRPGATGPIPFPAHSGPIPAGPAHVRAARSFGETVSMFGEGKPKGIPDTGLPK